MGTNAAATAAANLLRNFPKVQFGLMVEIGGGVPSEPVPYAKQVKSLGAALSFNNEKKLV
jgi:hypothetical protein